MGSGEVDFREQQGVYVLYDDSFRLVYVGQAGSGQNQKLLSRLRQHTRDALADRWTRFSWYGVRWVTQQNVLAIEAQGRHVEMIDVLNHIEAILITAAEPPLNRQGGLFGEEVEQYLQYRDQGALGPTMENMISDLWEEKNSP